MTRLSNRSGASTPFTAWSTLFYLLLVFIAPFALLGSVHADEDVQESYGTGKSAGKLARIKLTRSSYRY